LVADHSDIPVVILCGGMGTRLREASEHLPKPMVDIGGKPILWHIMKTYSHHGFNRFVLCLGYKSEEIKRFFLAHRYHASDFTLDMAHDLNLTFHNDSGREDWEITFVETGLETQTGARLRRVRDYLGDGTFMLTYGDGVGKVDISTLLATHRRGGTTGTVTVVHPTGRYGEVNLDEGGSLVTDFAEKPVKTGWVSGGYFVFERSFADAYLDDDPLLALESTPLQRLARDHQLSVHQHEDFWMGMDTFRDWTFLNGLWDAGQAPWRVWD
jgi:glucose-1-phosphate cytidylyltransferase